MTVENIATAFLLLLGAGAILIAITFFGVLGNFATNQGVTIGNRGNNTSTNLTTLQTGNVNAGTLGGTVPDVLAKLFQEAGSKVGTPSALIAAISFQECNKLWTAARQNPTLIQGWITNNTVVDSRGCVGNNYAGAGGPMQFTSPTFEGFRKQIESLTGHVPASKFTVRDSVYGAAIKLRSDSRILQKTGGRVPQVSDWDERYLRLAAQRYFGACTADAFGQIVHYCDDIVRRYHQYSQ